MAGQPTSRAPGLVVVVGRQTPQCVEKAWDNVHECSCLRTEGHLDLQKDENWAWCKITRCQCRSESMP